MRTEAVVVLLGLFLLADTTFALERCENRQLEKYHLNDACDRAQHNQYRNSFTGYNVHKEVTAAGPDKLPTLKTIVCPEGSNDDIDTDDEDLTENVQLEGFHTVWLVENQASTPVVVALVDKKRSGVEVSAWNEKIRPAHSDPNAILQPGQWRVFFTYEGKVYHVRSLLDDGQTLGPVLLKHRIGLIPITNKYGPADITRYCDLTKPDLPPPKPDNPAVIDPEFKRDPQTFGRPCNILDVGMRNDVGCPLHVYWTGTQPPNTTTGQPTCAEDFKFHLGLNSRPGDFVWDWDSRFEWQGTFVEHYFLFRLADDPSVLVDVMKLEPTRVGDCPTGNKQRLRATTGTVVTPLGILHHVMGKTNATNHTMATTGGPSLSFNSTKNSRTYKYLLNSMGTF